MQWFLSRNGQTFGPYTLHQLQQMAARGELAAADFVCEQGRPWVEAGTLPQYFAFSSAHVPAPPAVDAPAIAPKSRTALNRIGCQVCGRGAMENRKLYRLSGPAVVVGWIFLVPSFLGMGFGLLSVAGCVAMMSDQQGHDSEVQTRRKQAESLMVNGGVPAIVRQKVLETIPLSDADFRSMNAAQTSIAHDALQLLLKPTEAQSRVVAGSMVGFAGTLFFIASFVGGLLGWILTMKKRVLQCRTCKATISAC